METESGQSVSMLGDPMLTLSLRPRAAMTIGILFLMTAKPGLRDSLLAIAVAAIIGVVSAVPVFRTERSARVS